MSQGHAETLYSELAGRIRPTDPASFVFDPKDYQIHREESPVVALAWVKGQLGIVVWNLAPGQENDYHMHPTTEHVHFVVGGEVEYDLADLPPVRVGVGQAVIVPAGVPHGVRNVSDQPASYVAVTSPGRYEKVLVERPGGAVGDEIN